MLQQKIDWLKEKKTTIKSFPIINIKEGKKKKEKLQKKKFRSALTPQAFTKCDLSVLHSL